MSGAARSLSRRTFLNWSQLALAGLSSVPLLERSALAEAVAKKATAAPDYYTKLGVRRVINAKGTFTYLTAAVMPPQVQQAVAQAALHPVHLQELQTNAGEYLAKKLKCEGALVSCGASAALTLATAAAVQHANGCKTTEIPHEIMSGKYPKNEVIVQKSHRYEYDHSMFLCGVKIIGMSPTYLHTRYLSQVEGGETWA